MLNPTFDITIGDYTLICLPDGLPDFYGKYLEHAELTDEIDLEIVTGTAHTKNYFLAVRDHRIWPFLIVAQGYSEVFPPGALIVPETHLLFIGAGERLLAYRLDHPTKLWEDKADTGFWSWARHGKSILMSAELELAAWDLEGHKQWSTYVEPPWDYSVVDGVVCLDVMGKKSSFSLETGPK